VRLFQTSYRRFCVTYSFPSLFTDIEVFVAKLVILALPHGPVFVNYLLSHGNLLRFTGNNGTFNYGKTDRT
jgi:hypothetical protein